MRNVGKVGCDVTDWMMTFEEEGKQTDVLPELG